MRTSMLRQAGFCRAALASRQIQIISRASPSAAALAVSLTQTPRALAALSRPLGASLRFYSAEGAASEDQSSNGLVTRFADLATLGVHENIVSSITQGLGYENMTDVQSMTISPALAGKDLVAQAKTGTGKTLAFLVPVLQNMITKDPDLAVRGRYRRARSDDIRAIILSPTRELAQQIAEEAMKLTRNTGIVTQIAVGGTQKREMLSKTRREGCHLLIATPGRLHDLLEDQYSGIDAPNLSALVLDEADRMLEVGFEQELDRISTFLPNRSDVPRQTLLFSATVPKDVVGIARKYINPKNFEFVQTVKADEVLTHERVPQYIVPCKGYENMFPTLLELIERESTSDKEPFKAIVFCPTTAGTQLYAAALKRLEYQNRDMPKVIDIHSKLNQSQRSWAAESFKKAKSAILVSSDVTARGMDFPNVTHVIQIHTPPNREQYIHRIGRTGRAGKIGQAYLLVGDVELSSARSLLPGLPIQRCSDLESATTDASQGGNKHFDAAREAHERLPEHLKSETYSSMLGNASKHVRKQELVYALNDLAKYTWNMDQPPAVRSSILRNFGRIDGLRAEGHSEHRGVDHGRGGFDGGRGRGGGFGGRRGGDDFDRIAQSNDRGRRGGFERRAPRPSF